MKFVNLHTHFYTHSENILEIVNQYPNDFSAEIPLYSIGIHPWHIDENRLSDDLKIIKEKLLLNNCIALGECGLDKRIEKIYSTQIAVFESQLELLHEVSKPVILHCVASFDEVISCKKNSGLSSPFIIHGFSKNYQVAKQLLNQDFHLSFGKYLLRNPDLGEVFKQIPNEKIFLETDTIAESLEEVYTFTAKCKNISVEEMKEIVWNNYQTVFKQ
ncbi:TatD family hydrolase [Flavobacterium urocaniciphilum]|uniref:TatD DNase family protein n=1 Tax=Flavobacterium urocaniciphilum TaxID=1299341 RepID=A0A1H9CSL2_9FLAO|nr:TatD family hydrolase [Flavobacterium urocaniciphilum]SEQ04154.1 TatD DNase family protein [Flavobacterium urocaniciphilum]